MAGAGPGAAPPRVPLLLATVGATVGLEWREGRNRAKIEKSLACARKRGQVAQLVEQRTENPHLALSPGCDSQRQNTPNSRNSKGLRDYPQRQAATACALSSSTNRHQNRHQIFALCSWRDQLAERHSPRKEIRGEYRSAPSRGGHNELFPGGAAARRQALQCTARCLQFPPTLCGPL